MRKTLLLCLFTLFLSLPVQALRIVSLKPNITEILFALGAGDQVIGVTSYCQRPPEAKRLPKVGDYMHVSVERVLQLNPDLIIGSRENSQASELEFLMQRGYRVELLDFGSFEEMFRSMLRIGALAGRKAEAERVVAQMRRDLEALKQRTQKLRPRGALFIVGFEPLIVAGGRNFFSEAAPYLGLSNLAAKSEIPYPNYSTERLLRSAPEVIVELAMGSESGGAAEKWERFPNLPAVRQGKVIRFDIEKFRAAPGLAKALEELAREIHPELR